MLAESTIDKMGYEVLITKQEVKDMVDKCVQDRKSEVSDPKTSADACFEILDWIFDRIEERMPSRPLHDDEREHYGKQIRDAKIKACGRMTSKSEAFATMFSRVNADCIKWFDWTFRIEKPKMAKWEMKLARQNWVEHHGGETWNRDENGRIVNSELHAAEVGEATLRKSRSGKKVSSKRKIKKGSREYRAAELRRKLMEQVPDGFLEGVFESKRRNKIKIRYKLDDYARAKRLRNGVIRYYLKFVKEDEPKIVSFDGIHPDINGWRAGDLVEMDVKSDEWEWMGKRYYGYFQASDIVNISLMTGYGRVDGDEKPELKFYD